MTEQQMQDCLKNFMSALDSPVGRMKYKDDKFLMECVEFAKNSGYYNIRRGMAQDSILNEEERRLALVHDVNHDGSYRLLGTIDAIKALRTRLGPHFGLKDAKDTVQTFQRAVGILK